MLQNAMQLLEGVDVETEASGNVMLQTVGKIASTGVHFISCGYLTHSVTALVIRGTSCLLLKGKTCCRCNLFCIATYI